MSSISQQLQDVVSFGPSLIAALILGTIIGWERFRRHRAPTVSTFIVLCAASCLAVKSAILVSHGVLTDWNLPAAVLTGVGFVGGAFIVWRDNSLEGVTTGMTVFFTAVIGITCGLGLYAVATVAVLSTLGVMAVSCRIWKGSDDLPPHHRRPHRHGCPCEPDPGPSDHGSSDHSPTGDGTQS